MITPSTQSGSSLTVGLVVRNGEKHLAESLESLFHQTWTGFEVVVYDNASTDSTPIILHRGAWREPRLRIVRHPRDIGPLANFIYAAERAATELFCWASHDDLHDARFLETLVDLLHMHPEAGLALCAVRNIDPNGQAREIRPETRSLRTSTGMNSVERMLMHLRDGAGTPFYGVYRTEALHRILPTLRAIAEMPGPAMLGVDMVFVSAFLKDHHIAVSHETLLLFRRGGWSHRLDTYGSLSHYLRQWQRFRRTWAQATHDPSHSTGQRIRIALARQRFLLRYACSPAMRRMTWHYVRPLFRPWQGAMSWIQMWSKPEFRRLRRRIRALPIGSQIALFGAGKHTQRCLGILFAAAGKHASLVAVGDDHARECAPLPGLPVVHTSELAALVPRVVLISSDAYESALMTRAREVVPGHIPVWSIYDPTLEQHDSARSSAFTSSRNLISSSEALDSLSEQFFPSKAA